MDAARMPEPPGSSKDASTSILEAAGGTEALKPGGVIAAGTSSTTGIGLAIAAVIELLTSWESVRMIFS
jgi:cysteine synthase